MIVCSCSGITDRDIRRAIDWMRDSDPDTLITPRKVYRALGHRPDCGGCMKLLMATMRHAVALPPQAGRREASIPDLRPLPVIQDRK